ncbi:MAG TPA: DUF6515 family protein [Steroidobacteraceae bacterium]|nr:DUF6515 family protein [Steroidobacteraceae bacterium]
MHMPRTNVLTLLAFALCSFAAFGLANAQEHPDRHESHFDRGHEHFDTRYNHDHAYPARGAFVGALPREHFEVVHGGAHYFFAGGVWYAPRGAGWVVVAPPFGVFIPVLPPFYTTIWVGGAPYYYADDAYYVYRGPDQGYEVVPPPPDQSVQTAAPPGPEGQMFAYPRNGQSPDQQARDRYECHTWAVSQTGFDPMTVGGGVPPPQNAGKRADYDRAMAACLEGRGYTVR